MDHVRIDEVDDEPHPMGVNTHRTPVSDALGTDAVAIVHYRLAPGESFSGGLHTHHDQEEIFIVLEGVATFDVGREREEVTVAAAEAVRFGPGEFQFGRNETDDRVVGLVIAAPGGRHDWTAIESLAPCPDCGEETSHEVELLAGGELLARCEACGNELRSG